jgi:hypothetical protein
MTSKLIFSFTLYFITALFIVQTIGDYYNNFVEIVELSENIEIIELENEEEQDQIFFNHFRLFLCTKSLELYNFKNTGNYPNILSVLDNPPELL